MDAGVREVDELEQPGVVLGAQRGAGGAQHEVPQGPGVRVVARHR
ncbi:hypothetical protein RHODO2019_15620 [Rhodococcus antarcticus]|uniref:Uncharacterized protein n=1 Tax=Rhodococcus antarcticus TaxID=2987751 RepID=A0ABY6NYR0_9NOCA|nr:hypothetical protein [Rhodococcus antarcticus]UZJ24535.1 hypothetical protein RHODO2019_15620 [Rhodococcus antarcticus]